MRHAHDPDSPGGPVTPDAELVRAARRGDKRAFVEIVARHQALVCGIAFGILNDFAASEDAAQEAFLTGWRKIHDLRDPNALRAWLGQIARNAALGLLRRTRGEEALEAALELADQSPGPHEAAVSDEEAALVRSALEKLPESYRVPLVLFYREGQSVRAVAEALEISEDAAKQRLARGRELLRDRMSGLLESVLGRTKPGPVFTMTIAAAIGALAAPAAMAGAVFGASSAASSTSLFATMSTSKPILASAALAVAISIPIGYETAGRVRTPTIGERTSSSLSPGQAAPTAHSFESSALFTEWRALHEKYGTDAKAMPAIYQAIDQLKDPFKREAFRAALFAEWVRVDPHGGLDFTLEPRRHLVQFVTEWLLLDARAAVDAFLSHPKWDPLVRVPLREIALKVPDRVPEIVARLPKVDSFWDAAITDSFAIIAEGNVDQVREIAEKLPEANRAPALAGVVKTWARTDLDAALNWAQQFPDEASRKEMIRLALIGKAAADPVAALDRVHSVPAGGSDSLYASTTAARVLREASKASFESTVEWLTANRGRLSRDDIEGISGPVTERLNADAEGFLAKHSNDGSLGALLPAVESALLNNAGGQREAVWKWLKEQPKTGDIRLLERSLLNAAAWQDPPLAIRLVNDLPDTAEGEAQVNQVANSLLQARLFRFDKLFPQLPERVRPAFVRAAFDNLTEENFGSPQFWIERLSQLPEDARQAGVHSIAHAWGAAAPEEAAQWADSLPAGETRERAFMKLSAAWIDKDEVGAAQWINSLPPSLDRDVSAEELVYKLASKHPHQAWQWTVSIRDELHRTRAAFHAVQIMASRDRTTAEQWIATGPFTPETKLRMQNVIRPRK